MRRFIPYILTILLFSACQDDTLTGGGEKTNQLSIKASIPTLEVASRASADLTDPIYARSFDGTAFGDPISPVSQSGDVYLYNIPEEAQRVLFSNLSDEESAYETTTSSGYLLEISRKDSVYSSDVYWGQIQIASPHPASSYSVSFERPVAKLRIELKAIVGEDTLSDISARFQGASIKLSNLYGGVALSPDFEPVYTGESSVNVELLKTDLNATGGTILSNDRIYTFPSQGEMPLLLTVTQSNGSKIDFTTQIKKSFEPNKYYLMTLYLKQATASVHFSLDNVVVVENTFSPQDINSTSLLNASVENPVLEKANGSSSAFGVFTKFSNWTAEVTEGREWMKIECTGNQASGDSVWIVATSENTDVCRRGIITLRAGDISKTVTVDQFGKPQTIKIYGNKNNSGFVISGQHIIVDYGDGTVTGPLDADNKWIGPQGDNNYTITAGTLTDFSWGGVSDSIRFTDCVTLEDLTINELQSSSLDLSALPNLKELSLQSTKVSQLDLHQNPLLEKLTLNSNSNMGRIDLFSNKALQEIELNGSNKLKEISLNNFPNLETFRCDYCAELSLLSLDSCPQLTSLSTSSTSKLTNIVLSRCYTLPKLDLNWQAALANLTLQECNGLRQLKVNNCSSLNQLDITGCPALEEVESSGSTSIYRIMAGNLSNLRKLSYDNSQNRLDELDLSNCTALSVLESYGWDSPVKLNLTNCSSLSHLTLKGSNLKELMLDGCENIDSLFCRDIRSLDNFEIGKLTRLTRLSWTLESDTSHCQLDVNGIPNVRKLYIQDINPVTLNLNNCKELQTLSLEGCSQLTRIETNEIVSLRELQVRNCNRLLSLNLHPEGGLKKASFYNTQLSSLDLHSSATLEEFSWGGGIIQNSTLNFKDYTALKSFTFTSVHADGSYYENGQTQDTWLSNHYYTIDLSGCSALTKFDGSWSGGLQAVDCSDCTALFSFNGSLSSLNSLSFQGCSKTLVEVNCKQCQFEVDGIAALFGTLPDRTKETVPGTINIADNPGTTNADISIAENKKWTVNKF